MNLNILLHEVIASEYKEVKRIAKELDPKIPLKIEGIYDKWFNGKNRIYLPINQDLVSKLYIETRNILEQFGYTITNWKKGIAAKETMKKMRNGTEVPIKFEKTIDQILNGIPEQYFSKVKSSGIYVIKNPNGDIRSSKPKEGIGSGDSNIDKKSRFIRAITQHMSQSGEVEELTHASELMVVISRHMFDIAKQSYKRIWDNESCKELSNGSNRRYIPIEMNVGVLVAYVIDVDDLKIDRPLARSLIIPYINKDDYNDIYLQISPKIYPKGTIIKGFAETVQSWLDSKQGQKTGMFCINDKVYSDINPSTVNKYDYENMSIDDKLKMLGLTRI